MTFTVFRNITFCNPCATTIHQLTSHYWKFALTMIPRLRPIRFPLYVNPIHPSISHLQLNLNTISYRITERAHKYPRGIRSRSGETAPAALKPPSRFPHSGETTQSQDLSPRSMASCSSVVCTGGLGLRLGLVLLPQAEAGASTSG